MCVCVCVCVHAVYTRNCVMDGCNGILSFDRMEKCLVHFQHICVIYLRTHVAVHVSFPNGKVCNNVQVHVVTSIIMNLLFHLT